MRKVSHSGRAKELACCMINHSRAKELARCIVGEFAARQYKSVATSSHFPPWAVLNRDYCLLRFLGGLQGASMLEVGGKVDHYGE